MNKQEQQIISQSMSLLGKRLHKKMVKKLGKKGYSDEMRRRVKIRYEKSGKELTTGDILASGK